MSWIVIIVLSVIAAGTIGFDAAIYGLAAEVSRNQGYVIDPAFYQRAITPPSVYACTALAKVGLGILIVSTGLRTGVTDALIATCVAAAIMAVGKWAGAYLSPEIFVRWAVRDLKRRGTETFAFERIVLCWLRAVRPHLLTEQETWRGRDPGRPPIFVGDDLDNGSTVNLR